MMISAAPGQMTLGGMISKLREYPSLASVYFDFCYLGPTELKSFRGFYDHLALGFTDEADATVQTVLASAEAALNARFEGYKGGTYVMGPDVPIWIANWGVSTETYLSGITGSEHMVILQTAHHPD